MPSRLHAEPWVLVMRDNIKDRVGAAYRVVQQSGKAKLDVRFADGTRKAGTLPIPWDQEHSREIEDAAVAVAGHVQSGRTLKEAIAELGPTQLPRRVDTSTATLVMQTWEAFGEAKRMDGEIEQSTWDEAYANTARVLVKVAGSRDTNELLTLLGRHWEPGSGVRRQAVQHVAAMLRWATDPANGPALDPDRWFAPPKGGISRWVGRKSAALHAKTSEPTVPLFDEEILALLDALPVNHRHPRDREAARRWKFVFQLMATYGLRPIEVNHLVARGAHMWCTWVKKAGGGTTKPRRLYPLHRRWAEEWDLVERIRRGEPLPKPPKSRGIDQPMRQYLERCSAWAPMAARGCTPKSFRHGYSYRGHVQYGLGDRIMAASMGHSVPVHNSAYSQWAAEEQMEEAFARATERLAEG